MARRTPVRSIIDAVVMLAALALIALLARSLGLGVFEEGLVRVLDGDSLRREALEIRLYGIDAPEYRQHCRDGAGQDYECGRQAAEVLRQMIGGGDVACRPVETDRYGRLVALCSAGKLALNEEMVLAGWAVAYRRHTDRFARLEALARAARRGIWQGPFEMPEEYRARTRSPVQGNMAGGED
jgi:endonuclease YncB( thermonuclease family)